MAQACTYTEQKTGSVKLIIADWTTDATNGAVTGLSTTNVWNGELVYAAFDPDAGGTQPSDNYDVTVLDANGIDVLNGLGVNRSNAATVYVDKYDGLGAVANSALAVTIANGGNSKGGVVYLWIR